MRVCHFDGETIGSPTPDRMSRESPRVKEEHRGRPDMDGNWIETPENPKSPVEPKHGDAMVDTASWYVDPAYAVGGYPNIDGTWNHGSSATNRMSGDGSRVKDEHRNCSDMNEDWNENPSTVVNSTRLDHLTDSGAWSHEFLASTFDSSHPNNLAGSGDSAYVVSPADNGTSNGYPATPYEHAYAGTSPPTYHIRSSHSRFGPLHDNNLENKQQPKDIKPIWSILNPFYLPFEIICTIELAYRTTCPQFITVPQPIPLFVFPLLILIAEIFSAISEYGVHDLVYAHPLPNTTTRTIRTMTVMGCTFGSMVSRFLFAANTGVFPNVMVGAMWYEAYVVCGGSVLLCGFAAGLLGCIGYEAPAKSADERRNSVGEMMPRTGDIDARYARLEAEIDELKRVIG